MGETHPARDPAAAKHDAEAPAGEELAAPPVGVRDALVLFAKGVAMGTADLVPGVSGGTVALVAGVYRRLVEAIRSYTPRSLWRVVRALPGTGEKRVALWSALRALHVDFLVPLVLGVVSAVLILSEAMPALLARYPEPTNALFLGLVLGSVYVPYSQIPKLHVAYAGIALLSALLAYWLVGLPVVEERGSLPFLFVCGALAACAAILPGLSGSYVLKALGQYETVLTAIRDRDGDDVVLVGVFALGALVGVAAFVRALSWLLRRHEGATLAALTGLMVGALRSVWPFQTTVDGRRVNVLPDAFDDTVLVVIGCFVAGLAFALALPLVGRRLGRS